MVTISNGVKIPQQRRQYSPGFILIINSTSRHNRFTPMHENGVETSNNKHE